MRRLNLPRSAIAGLILLIALMRLGAGCARASDAGNKPEEVAISSVALTSFEEIWQVDPKKWHRVHLEYVVYMYDPVWKALWGRCGQTNNYISLGAKTFPIKPGQRILIDGLIQPADGMTVIDPKVTILSETEPLDVLTTTGRVGATEQLSQRLVTMSGYVERQAVRDANHLDVYLVVEDHLVLGQVLLRGEQPLPQLKGALVTAKGVYLARTQPDWVGPKIELWVQRPEDIEVSGTLDRDERFASPATPLVDLPAVTAGTLVHVRGVLQAQAPGKTLTIADDSRSVLVQSAQTLTLPAGTKVEAIGLVSSDGKAPVLRLALFREAKPLLTSISQMWGLPDAERQTWHRVHIEFLVYFYDPLWKALWGKSGELNEYITLEWKKFPIKPGQRILIEGSVLAANGTTITDPKVTILEESVPLEPLVIQGAIGDGERYNVRLVQVEGYVDRQVSNDQGHLQIDLIVDGRVVTGRVLMPEGANMPKWDGARLRMIGVYSATQDPTSTIPTIEIWCQGPERCEVLGWLDQDDRFKLPNTPIEKLSGMAAGSLVKITGAVRAQQQGKSLTVRDESGQITIDTAMSKAVLLGHAVEAVGNLRLEGTELRLEHGLYRLSQAAPAPPSVGLPTLRLADQLRELQPEEAARSYPVHLTGVVSWTRPNADFFYIRDMSGGVRVYRPPQIVGQLLLGSKVEITGVSASGSYTPVVLADHVETFSTFEVPEPRPVTLEQALTGIEEGQWVSMSGYVRAVVSDGPWARFELLTSAGEFQAMVPPNPRWEKIAGSVVRLPGVCSAIANNKRQLIGIQLWVPSSRFVNVEQAAPEDPFTVPTRAIASLRQFSSIEVMNRLVRVSGVVIHHSPGRLIQIQDGSEGLLVLSRDTKLLTPGDRIEAVGYPGRENSRVVLREAVYRKISAGIEPAAYPLESLTPIDAELDGRLVRVRGSLVDINTHEQGLRLIAQQGEKIFEALLDTKQNSLPAGWASGSQVALTGVYQIQFDEYRRPHSVSLQLRTPQDVSVLVRASWWTKQRALGATAILAVGVVLGFGWVVALRRRVHKQTDVIREQLENEKAARLEAALTRASKLESLGVLAGGIAHDFNNLLTVVMGNLSLARLDPNIDADTVHCLKESERAAARARDLTQQLLTFAKGGEPIRVSARLPEVIREAAQFALHGSKIRCEFEFAPDLWLANIDKGQIGQVAHNIVINASQAMPGSGQIQIVLSNAELTQPRGPLLPGKYVKMSFTDTGAGISPENVARIFEPYFTTKKNGSGLGLATVYSIVKKHDGHVEVASKVGEGTTFTIWLPAAVAATEAVTPVQAVAKPAGSARILFMDDEATIRNLGSSVLKRMGMEVTAVSDGSAAVSEYASASAAGHPYDLVIMDLTVPGGMGGGEAMEKLRAMDSNVRAIVSSGYSSDPVMANYRAHGFMARVPKPYLAGDLIAAVNSLLGR